MLLYDSFHLPYIYNTPSVLWIFKIFYHTFHLFTSHHNYLNTKPCKWYFHATYKGSHSQKFAVKFTSLMHSSILQTFPFSCSGHISPELCISLAYQLFLTALYLCLFNCIPQILFWGKILPPPQYFYTT